MSDRASSQARTLFEKVWDRHVIADYGGGFALTQHKVQVAQVNEDAERLAGDEHRIPAIERIDQQHQTATDRENPERQRNDAAAGALGRDPLHQKSHGEKALGNEAHQHPPIEPGDEDILQVRADGARQINEQE